MLYFQNCCCCPEWVNGFKWVSFTVRHAYTITITNIHMEKGNQRLMPCHATQSIWLQKEREIVDEFCFVISVILFAKHNYKNIQNFVKLVAILPNVSVPQGKMWPTKNKITVLSTMLHGASAFHTYLCLNASNGCQFLYICHF